MPSFLVVDTPQNRLACRRRLGNFAPYLYEKFILVPCLFFIERIQRGRVKGLGEAMSKAAEAFLKGFFFVSAFIR